MSAKLTVDGIEYPLDTEKTLLENLESQAVKMEFHCRDGHCGACRCLLISGQAEYIS
ncbi:2Fe-2S iron-sulfur cluster-binding protein, partial [Psychromonas ossibalaenae]|uniref:2Fe-2S iron-sulfur cluster-binding protein n=1 Tax=Psychromonas ossibalaenae TaxID=444922 RepID=UPI0003819857